MKNIRLEKSFLNFITPMQWHKKKYQQIPKIDIYHADNYLGEILHLPNLNDGDFEEIFEKLCQKFKTFPATYDQLRLDIGENFPSHVYYFLN
ncbi:hypothetical protein OAT67_09425, partial [Bacteriovoracaceae bacterium]|nr:hypothetical protein [Bacteriovoracaceae bacterium]